MRTTKIWFANVQSSNIIFNAANTLINDTQRNRELRNWFKDLNTYIHKVRSLLIFPVESSTWICMLRLSDSCIKISCFVYKVELSLRPILLLHNKRTVSPNHSKMDIRTCDHFPARTSPSPQNLALTGHCALDPKTSCTTHNIRRIELLPQGNEAVHITLIDLCGSNIIKREIIVLCYIHCRTPFD
jgi:hypothetical protein